MKPQEEKKWWQWAESWDEVISSREFLQNAWRDKLFNSQQIREPKSSSTEFGQTILKPSADENGYFEQGKILTLLKLLHAKEETFKEIFMGFRFSFHPTNGRVLLEMNVSPSSEKRSGLIIRF